MPSAINTPIYNKLKTKLGVKPTAPPPYYKPGIVAAAILYVAEHPTRDLIVGDAGKVLDILQRLSPALVDNFLLLIGFAGQRTDESKSEDATNNVFEPIQGYDRVEGDFRNSTIPTFTDWLDMNPPLKWGALAVAALGAAAVLGGWFPGNGV